MFQTDLDTARRQVRLGPLTRWIYNMTSTTHTHTTRSCVEKQGRWSQNKERWTAKQMSPLKWVRIVWKKEHSWFEKKCAASINRQCCFQTQTSVASTKGSTLQPAALHQLVLSVQSPGERLRCSCVQVASTAAVKTQTKQNNLTLAHQILWQQDVRSSSKTSSPCHSTACYVALARDGTISTWNWKLKHQVRWQREECWCFIWETPIKVYITFQTVTLQVI